MSKIMLALAGSTALIVAVPAVGQTSTYSRADLNSGAWASQRIDQLEERLDDGIEAGSIDRTEARNLRVQIRELNRLESRYLADGSLSQTERTDLIQRMRTTRQQLRVADGGRSQYAEWRDDDPYSGYNPNTSYGSNASNDGEYAQVNEVCAASTSSGKSAKINAFLGRIFGADNCLRVGERVTTSLNAVPSEYRDDFPSRSGYRYGYVEGNVVEINSRTGVVARIYDVS